MQSAPDKLNPDEAESMFDFLNAMDDKMTRGQPQGALDAPVPEEPSSGRVRSGSRDPKASKPYPVIRRPVSVARSGPLRPPRPGEPVDSPHVAAEIDRSAPARPSLANARKDSFTDLDELDLDLGSEEWPNSEQWVDRSSRPFPMAEEPVRGGVARKLGYVFATLLIVAGVGAALYSQPQVRPWVDQKTAAATQFVEQSTGLNLDFMGTGSTAVDTPVDSLGTQLAIEPEPAGAPVDVQTTTSAENQPTAPAVAAVDAPVAPSANAPKSLNTLFKDELARLEGLMEQGAVDEAEAILQNMDRAVYGYGAPEFTQIREQIAEANAAGIAASEQAAALLAEQQASEAEAARAELARVTAAQNAAIEAQRLEDARLDAARLAAQSAELESSPSQPAAELNSPEQINADRQAQERARLEQLAVATRERNLLEQERLAQQQLAVEQSALAANRQSDWQSVGGVDGAPESIEQIARREREAARQQRLADGQIADQAAAGGEASPSREPVARAATQPITDADLQRVYGQFSQLQDAIENRDVNTVIQLTERSGIRIQQMMQMFENNVSIQTRLRNVSTLDAAGEIQGTLQITRLERADGSVTGPPLNLGSVRLSSTRQDDNWSAIRW